MGARQLAHMVELQHTLYMYPDASQLSAEAFDGKKCLGTTQGLDWLSKLSCPSLSLCAPIRLGMVMKISAKI